MEKLNLFTIDELRAKGWIIDFKSFSRPGGDIFYRENFKKTIAPPRSYTPLTFQSYFLREGLGTPEGTLGYDENIIYNDWENYYTNARIIVPVNNLPINVQIRTGQYYDIGTGNGFLIRGITINDRRFIKLRLKVLSSNSPTYLTVSYSFDNGDTWVPVLIDEKSNLWTIPIDSANNVYTKEVVFEVQRTAVGQKTITLSIGNATKDGMGAPVMLTESIIGEFVEEQYIQFSAEKTFSETPPTILKDVTYREQNNMAGSIEDAEMICRMYCSAIEWGMAYTYPPSGPMLFPKEELFQWISPQQLAQFENMYPRCVEVSYNNALGTVYSQVGALLDIPAIIAGVDIDDGTTKVFTWILQVLTAYNILAPAPQRSDAMESNYRIAIAKLIEIKNGASSTVNAPLKAEPNTMGVVIKKGCKMLG